MDCPELQNSLYYWWRTVATVGVVTLSGFLHYYYTKCLKLQEKNRQLKIKLSDHVNVTKNADAVQKESKTEHVNHTHLNNNNTMEMVMKKRHIEQHQVKSEQNVVENGISTDATDDGMFVNQKLPRLETTLSMQPSATKFDEPKMERSQIVVENPSHVTRIDNIATTNSRYKITKIVTTVEVTLQPTGSYETSSVKVDTLSIDDVTKIEQGKDEVDKSEERFEESHNIKSLLEVTNAQSIEEIVEKVVTLESVRDIIREAGLESSNLIFGIDYTASNKFQGKNSFHGKSLHSIETGVLNPYQQVISVLGKTLASFANSGFIAGYGFGDSKTEDKAVFPLKTETGFCKSFSEILDVYNEVTPTVILSGPTNFAPLIREAIKICLEVKTYHILVIVADGQVTNETETREAIVDACQYPLSIIVVGVGDGPWEIMKVFDESLPKRTWDNFTFAEFHKVTSTANNPETAFAVKALMEIPDQYKKIKSMGLLRR